MIIFSFSQGEKAWDGTQWNEGDVRSFTLKYDFHIPFIIFFFLPFFSVSFRYLCERSEQQHKKKMPYSNVTIIIHTAMKYRFVMHFWLVAFHVVCCRLQRVGSCVFFVYPFMSIHIFLNSSSHEGNISITSHRTHIRSFRLITSQREQTQKKKTSKIEKKWSERQYISQKSN